MNGENIDNRASSDELSIAEQFVRARLDARLLAQYPGAIPADLTAAYRCQDIAIARWPDRIGGWKVTARLPPAWHAKYGDERMIGPAFTPNIRSAATGQLVDCPVFAGGFAAFEPDGPLAAFAFTLGKCARRGRPLQAGAAVTTGTITRAHDIRPGQSSRYVYEGLGEIRCRAVQATPRPLNEDQ